jgi:ABC-type Na+ efflux pump permease subunit
MMTLLLKYQIHSDTELVTDYEISNFGSTIISIIAVGVLLFLNLPYVRMILPSYFWIDSLLVTIPVTLAAIMIRLIAGQLRDYSKLE